MKQLFIVFTLLLCACTGLANIKTDSTVYQGNHPFIQYTGRIDYSTTTLPRFWAPGTYLTIRFKGTYCVLEINDEEKWGTTHNYLEIKVDNQPSKRIQTTQKKNRIVLASGLPDGLHTIVVCKNTEAEIGYLEVTAVICKKLVSPAKKPARKIEFIGNSITCGMGMNASSVACNTKNWYDQHHAYMAYGPQTSRALNAQWHLSSVSGIGLMHSCCNKITVMPQLFDKINMAENKLQWNFQNYQPDVVTVCLGQNDGIQDSAAFCNAYINFISNLRSYYPKAKIVMLSSPMADASLTGFLKKSITAVEAHLRKNGEVNIGKYFFSKRYANGCDSHPDAAEHTAIAEELTAYLKALMKW
ncbi:MAG: SGNH/GDSL hydrolase family protein [Chitinophagaceae bacterium]|nr:SGNH/GDSL hydrolase family protein [Chitinophagaceae bacterium]